MKSKLSLLITLVLLAFTSAAFARNDSPAGSATAAPSDSSAQPAPADNSATASATPADAAKASGDTAPATSAAPKDSTVSAAETPSSPAPAAAAPIVAANEKQPEAPATPAPAVTTTTTNNASAPVIPLIVMDDVPLTDAIKNLARQAGLNYMLDPKIGYGQPGPDGKPTPQPSVSIRWENVTAEQALNALLNNYSLQLLEDPKTKIARITIKDPAAPDPLITKIVQLKYAPASNIIASVQTALTDKRSKVVADVRTSQLVVVATEKEINEVDQMVERLDTITKQVLIEARLLETSMNPSTAKGMDWSGTLEAQHLAFGNNLQTPPTTASDNKTLATLFPKMLFDTAKGFNPATAFLDADGVNAVFSFLNKNAEAKVISAPRTVTLDNEPARIEVTRASPIINVTAGTANTTGGSQITYTNLGIILNVTPRISANNYVNLKVVPEVSRIFDTVTKSLGTSGIFQADEYDIRRMETRVMIPSGNTLVLGGLVQDDVRQSNTKVPLLGDIPFLGLAFRSDTKTRAKNNLIIFVTPTIVQEEDYQPTKTDFLKTPTPAQDAVDGDWSAWDSGKPADWSKSAK
jgi:type II secretory pathway component GspD/PulD (secretin)